MIHYDSQASQSAEGGMKQLTVRGFDKDLERRLRDVARAKGVSLNQAALLLMREGAGIQSPRRRANVVGESLDALIGSWSKNEEATFLRAIAAFDKVDPAFWR